MREGRGGQAPEVAVVGLGPEFLEEDDVWRLWMGVGAGGGGVAEKVGDVGQARGVVLGEVFEAPDVVG